MSATQVTSGSSRKSVCGGFTTTGTKQFSINSTETDPENRDIASFQGHMVRLYCLFTIILNGCVLGDKVYGERLDKAVIIVYLLAGKNGASVTYFCIAGKKC